MAETQSSAGGSSLSKVSGDSLLNLLLSRIDAMCADIKSVREENKAIINKVDSSEKILKETLSSLQKETINNKKDITNLKKDNILLKQENFHMKSKLNNIEQLTRYNAIRITNVPVVEGENLGEIIDAICKHINFNYNNNNIEYFRLKLNNTEYPAPIMLKFLKQSDKEEFMKSLKSINFNVTTDIITDLTQKNPIYFSENMSPFYSALFKKAKILKNNNLIKFVWFKNNKLFIKVSENSKPTVIQCEEDLHLLNEREMFNIRRSSKSVDEVEISDLDTDVSESSRASYKKRKLKSAGSATLHNFFRQTSSLSQGK